MLKINRTTGTFAKAFVAELAVRSSEQSIDIFAIYDEIGKLEGTDPRPSLTKKAERLRFSLKGYWHKHYFQARFLPRNLLNETERMSADGRWNAVFAPHHGEYIEECINQIAHEVVMGAFHRRSQDHRLTGEFIVFERLPNGSNYYLTLGSHGAWDEIRSRIDAHKEFDAPTGAL